MRVGVLLLPTDPWPETVERVRRLEELGYDHYDRPLASPDAFVDFVDRYRALGFTDLVFHHPRPGDPVWNEPEEIVEQIASVVRETRLIGER